jgi:starch synthase
MSAKPLDFAIYYAGDAYSTAQKIMGRQSAGKSFIKGLAKNYPDRAIHALGTHKQSAQNLFNQLRGDGHQGPVVWSTLPSFASAEQVGTLYYPAPPLSELAHARNQNNPGSFSIMGVTHTLSSHSAIDQIGSLVLPPFQPWDALICTSSAAQTMIKQLHEETREYWAKTTGAHKFVDIQLPVIPLGINTDDFGCTDEQKMAARQNLGIAPDEVVFLFAGRLTFHAKANPAPMYQALQKISGQHKVVCLEAGIFPNDGVQNAYKTAQKQLAPNVKFIWADGNQEDKYKKAWQAADVFVSLADNIQETFGITPLEAMASGLPVVVSDWDGYKDTVPHGEVGFRIPTCIAPAGNGVELALKHQLGVINYDTYIGSTSLATVVDPVQLQIAFQTLASQKNFRVEMGRKAQLLTKEKYDLKHILNRYIELKEHLYKIRKFYNEDKIILNYNSPNRIDPYRRFRCFPTSAFNINSKLSCSKPIEELDKIWELELTSYEINKLKTNKDAIIKIYRIISINPSIKAEHTLKLTGSLNEKGINLLMWLYKFDCLKIEN